MDLVGYFDADFASCVDSRKSTSGYIFIMVGGAVSWRSVKQTLIATSTMEAEFLSCFEATSQGVWLKSFILGLRVMDSISRLLRIFCDNSATMFLAKNNKRGSRSKHIDIKFLAIREHVKEKQVVIEYISTELMIVKRGKNSIFLKKGKTVILVENHKFFRSQMTKQTSPLNSSHEI